MKLLDFIKLHIKTLIIVVTSVAGAAGWIAARDARIEAAAVREFKTEIKVKNYDVQLEKLMDSVSLQSVTLQQISENQMELSGRFITMAKKFDTQTKALSNHFQKERMLQDNIDFLQELYNDEKKRIEETVNDVLSKHSIKVEKIKR